MISINMPVFGLSAVIAVGIVAIDMAQSRTPDPTPAATVSARFPKAHESFAALVPAVSVDKAAAKSDRMPVPAPGCTREHWPYMADECLISNTGTPVRKPARTITVERRIADAASQLAPVETITLASR